MSAFPDHPLRQAHIDTRVGRRIGYLVAGYGVGAGPAVNSVPAFPAIQHIVAGPAINEIVVIGSGQSFVGVAPDNPGAVRSKIRIILVRVGETSRDNRIQHGIGPLENFKRIQIGIAARIKLNAEYPRRGAEPHNRMRRGAHYNEADVHPSGQIVLASFRAENQIIVAGNKAI